MSWKLQLLLRRAKACDMQKFKSHIAAVKLDNDRRPSFLIGLDMLRCAAVYRIGFLDYEMFGFSHIRSHKARKTFFTMQDNWQLSRLANDPAEAELFRDKLQFCEAFRPFLGREFLNLKTASPEDLLRFLQAHPTVFVKGSLGYGGLMVERCDEDPKTLSLQRAKDLLEEWNARAFDLAEEEIIQHEKLASLYPYAVNTMRVCTLLDLSGEPHVLYTFLRAGRGGAAVDNTTNGGFSDMIPENGVICGPGLCEKTGEYFDAHPDTGTPFIGFAVPDYEPALELCKKAARLHPKMGYVGWDVAFTPNGPVLVEGNELPAYNVQTYRQLAHPGEGLLPRIRAIRPDFQ